MKILTILSILLILSHCQESTVQTDSGTRIGGIGYGVFIIILGFALSFCICLCSGATTKPE